MLVSRALGNKRIQPFGDFLLHDIGTGDGIVQNGGSSTRHSGDCMPARGSCTTSSAKFEESGIRTQESADS